ncbi:MAG: HDIG domain-containing protein, partial [Nitrososphaerota archaeon]
MNRDDALQLVRDHIKRENLYKHVLAVEAILRSVAEVLGEDVEKWGLLGLLHDLDFDEVQERPEQHGLRSVEMLAGKIDDELLRGIKAHNFEHTGVKPESRM